MEKKLIIEVKRLQELMGVEKEILTEERILSKVSNFLKKVLDGDEPTIPKTLTRVGNRNAEEFTLPDGNVVRLLDNEISEIRNAIRLGKGLNTLSDNTKSVLRQILKSTGNLNPKKLYDDYVDEIISQQGDEEKFFKALNRRLKEIDPTTRTAPTLKKVLQTEYFPDDTDFVDEILPYLDSKLDDYNNNLLVNRGGKLVKEVSPDIEDFEKNIISLTTDEIEKLKKSSWFSNLSNFFTKQEKIVEETKRLFKTLDSGTLKTEERLKVEDAILDKMNQISNWKSESEKYMNAFIEELGSDPKFKKLQEKLNKLKPQQGWNVVREVMDGSSFWKKRWAAFSESLKQLFRLEAKIINSIQNPGKAYDAFTRGFRKLFADNSGELPNDKKKEAAESLNKLFLTGSKRGFPDKSKIIDAEGNLRPDAYAKLREIGKNQLAWESYGYEWALKTIKYKMYYAFLETLVPFIFYKANFSRKNNECAIALAEVMKNRKITQSEDVVSLLAAGQTNIFPPCLIELQKNDERYQMFRVIAMADFYASPGSDMESKNFIFPQLKESFLKFSGLDDFTTVFPGFVDDVILDLIPTLKRLLRMYEVTGPAVVDQSNVRNDTPEPIELPILSENEISFRGWCTAQPNISFGSWNSETKEGTDSRGVRYKLSADRKKFDPISQSAPDNIIDTVEELYNQYPFLRENNSTITLNSNKTFNEKFPDGVNLTILIKDGVAYYSAYNGTPYPEPLPKVEKQ